VVTGTTCGVEEDGTVVATVVVATMLWVALALVAGTGYGTRLLGPDEEGVCEPTELGAWLE